MFAQNGLSLEKIKVAVELQQPCRGASDFGDAEDVCPRSLEMIIPCIFSRIEQSNDEIGVWIKTDEVGAFVQIAVHASQGEIFLNGLSAMLFGDDVLNMKWSVDFILHTKSAILATVSRPLTNLLSQPCVQDQAALKFWRNTSAFKRRMDINFPA